MTQGDQLVAINNETILGVPHSAIVDRLQDISRKGQPLKLVIARVPSPLSDEKEEDSASDIDVNISPSVTHPFIHPSIHPSILKIVL